MSDQPSTSDQSAAAVEALDASPNGGVGVDQPKPLPLSERTIRARYEQIEMEVDAFGRKISVKRLRPSQQMIVAEMSEGPLGVALLMQVASVVSIEDESGVTTYPPIGRDRGTRTFGTMERMRAANAISLPWWGTRRSSPPAS